MDITQQLLPLLDGDAVLQDPRVVPPIEFAINNGKGLGATCEPPSLRLVRRLRLAEEVIEVRRPLVGQRVGLYHWILIKLHDLGVRWSRWLVSP